MKKRHILYLLILSAILTCCGQKKVTVTHPTAQIEFEADTIDCGNIKSGEKVKFSYKFNNVGNTPLVINQAGGTCACTTVEYSKAPIQPGESGEIKVVYDSKSDMPSHFSKSVVVSSNSEEGTHVLLFKGLIEK